MEKQKKTNDSTKYYLSYLVSKYISRNKNTYIVDGFVSNGLERNIALFKR